MTPIHIRTFYPADPVGVVPGGIDTFIRGIIKWAPEDLEFSLVGMSTDPIQRPVGRWSSQVLGSRTFDFFPAVGVANAGQRTRVPLSLRYTSALMSERATLKRDFDVFDFHRPEPSLLFLPDNRPKVAYFHQDPEVVALGSSDMVWKHMPDTYERLEARAMAKINQAWCVRETGVKTLRARYPKLGSQIGFIPTWVDHEVFHPVANEAERNRLRARQAMQLGIDARAQWIVSVGRLDTQKDPALMLDAFARLCQAGADVQWLVIGDGRLRADLQRQANDAGIAERVHFLGLQPASAIADLLRSADLFALSSAYEGMPMAALEALGCGLPVVSTDVGEIRRVVRSGHNGLIVDGRDPHAFSLGLARGLNHAVIWGGEPAVQATHDYQPAKVLAGAYDVYRELGEPMRRVRLLARKQAAIAPGERARLEVIGTPVDHIDRRHAVGRLLHWAARHESRYACFCNVHSVIESHRDPRHRLVMIGADLVAADGAPVAWTVGRKAGERQERVDGPGTMWTLCERAQAQGLRIGLYGGSQDTLDKLRGQLRKRFPLLHIGYAVSPPFRALSPSEDAKVCTDIREAGVNLLFVGLGCPKQERWMAEHQGRIPAVMLGVGAAFDFYAGTIARAPAWMQRAGLEWAHRLSQDPRRLAGRYLVTNSRFLALNTVDVVRAKQRPTSGRALEGKSVSISGEKVRKAPTSPDIAAPTLRAPVALLPKVGHERKLDTVVQLEPRAVDELVARVDAALQLPGGRIVEFVSTREREGTSSVASAFATNHALQQQQLVLLLQASSNDDRPTLLDALAAGSLRQPDLVLQGLDGVYTARLGPTDTDHPSWAQLHREDLWEALRLQFDLIVLDMPPANTSRLALSTARLADGVVVVVEAERARAPVVRDLIERLKAVRANVLGTVLNKRRYHLPSTMYRWL